MDDKQDRVRFYNDLNQLPAHAIDFDNRVFTIDQIRYVCELIKAKQLPSDEKTSAIWRVIYNTLELHSK